jgi:hypothetical protein
MSCDFYGDRPPLSEPNSWNHIRVQGQNHKWDKALATMPPEHDHDLRHRLTEMT